MYENEFWILATSLSLFKKLSCNAEELSQLMRGLSCFGCDRRAVAFWRSLFFDAELFNSFLAQLAWLPVEKSSDLNLVTESPWTRDNLRPISVLTPNFYSICLHAPIPASAHARFPTPHKGFCIGINGVKTGAPGIISHQSPFIARHEAFVFLI